MVEWLVILKPLNKTSTATFLIYLKRSIREGTLYIREVNFRPFNGLQILRYIPFMQAWYARARLAITRASLKLLKSNFVMPQEERCWAIKRTTHIKTVACSRLKQTSRQQTRRDAVLIKELTCIGTLIKMARSAWTTGVNQIWNFIWRSAGDLGLLPSALRAAFAVPFYLPDKMVAPPRIELGCP